MPLYQVLSIESHTKIYIWKITESFNELFRSVVLKDVSLARVEKMKAESHQKGFLAVRKLLEVAGYDDFDLNYDEFGKPHLGEIQNSKIKIGDLLSLPFEEIMVDKSFLGTMNSKLETRNPLHISISHSNDFSVIAVSDYRLGIDLEILKEKTLKLAPRYMDISHLEGLSAMEALEKATVIWGIKESIFKIKNEPGISFKDHIIENKFNCCDGKCKAQFRFEEQLEYFDIRYQRIENYVLVVAFEST